ncbi:hypothetical protein HQ545_08975, partial [Candidatus Woesearchaeota archaeon]|nr:hypothetical protein [Candidatus Woesearchaeota archaeon]
MKNKIYIGLIVFILLPAVFATCPFESLSAGASGSDLETMSSEVQGEYDSSVQAAAENIANQLRGKTPVTSAPEITVTPEMRDAIAAKLAARGSEPIVTAPTIEVTPEMQAAIAAKMDAQRATVIDTVASTGDEPATLPDAEGFVNNGRRLRSRTATPQSSCPPGQRCLENLDRGDGTAPSQPTAGNLLGNPPIAGESSQEMPASVAGTTPTDATTTPDTPATPTETIEISPGVLLLPQTDGTFEVDAPRHPGWSGVIVSMDQEENAIVFVRSSVSDEDWNEAEDSGFTQQIESAVRASVEERSLENLPDDVWDTDYLPIQEREDTAPITSPPSAPATPAEPIELAEGFYLMSESDGVFEIGFGGTATSNLRAVIEDGEINMFTVDANGERTEWNPESGIRANIDAALRTAIAEQAETTSQTQMVASSRIEAEATSETITTPVGEPESIPLNYGDLVLTPGQGNDYSIMFSGESGNEDTAVRVRRNEYGEVVYTDAEGNALSIDDVSNLDSQVIEAIQNNLPNADGETPAAPAADETPDTTEGEEAPESDETTEDDEEPEDETPAEDEDETGIPSSTTLGNGVTITVRPDGTSSITAPNGVLIASGNLNDDGTISYTDAAGNPISDEEIQQTLAVTPQQLEEMDEAVSRGPNFATRQRMDALELWSGAANKYGGWVGLFMKPG